MELPEILRANQKCLLRTTVRTRTDINVFKPRFCLFVCFNNRRHLASFVKCPSSEVSNPNKSSKQNIRERLSASSANADAYEFAAFSLLSPFRHMKIFAAILCGTKSKRSIRLSASDESTPLFSFSIFN